MWVDVGKMGTVCLSPPNSRDLLGVFLGDLPSPNGVVGTGGEAKGSGVDNDICLLLNPEWVPNCPQSVSLCPRFGLSRHSRGAGELTAGAVGGT